MTILTALLASVLFGVGDFFGGSASRKSPVAGVLLASGVVGLPLLAALAVLGPGSVSAGAMVWGAMAGVGGGLGVLLLFRGLAGAAMSVVAPLTAVMSAVVPVLIGVATGERPPALAYVGMILALLAVTLISRGERHGAGDTDVAPATRAGVLLALLAGTFFGLYFVLLKQAPADSGVWPVLAGRISAVALFVVIAVRTTGLRFPSGRAGALALLSGLVDTVANVLFLVAVRGGLLSLIAVIVALYPASTVLLARVVFAERLARAQLLGLACAAAGVAVMAAG
ncbi:MAG: DMT family transporter [Actinomycetota bacterium]|nr:DMT family transporter [Actinomycetota bacterium]